MCILIAKPKSVRKPTMTELETSAANNPDGCGVAWVQNKKLHIYHSSKIDGTFRNILESIPDNAPAIYHFRIATHGGVNLRNCHPFVSDDNKIAFAHNGVLSIQNDKERDWTDSETAFKYLFLPILQVYKIDSQQFTAAVNTIIGSSKFAFLQSDGTLTTFGNFINEDGLMFSNTSYKPYTYSLSSVGKLGKSYAGCGSTYGDYGGYYDDSYYDNYFDNKWSSWEEQYDAAYEEIEQDAMALLCDKEGRLVDSIDKEHFDELVEVLFNEYGMIYNSLKQIDYKSIVQDICHYYGIEITDKDGNKQPTIASVAAQV